MRLLRPSSVVSFAAMFLLLTMIISSALFRLFPESSRHRPGVVPLPPPSSSFAKSAAAATSRCFRRYISTCPHADSYLSRSSCYNPFGVRASLFESLETLLLLGLDQDFAAASQRISEISVSDFRWVNRHEFWSRVIGSLIGAHLLSGRRFFLDKAIDFADLLLPFQQLPFPTFVHLPDSRGNTSGFGTCLSDCAAGLPEIASLFRLTGDSRYRSAFDFLSTHFPEPLSGHYYDFYRTRRIPVGRHTNLNGHQVGFFLNVALASLIVPAPQLDAALNITSAADSPRYRVPLMIAGRRLVDDEFVAAVEDDFFADAPVADSQDVKPVASCEGEAMVPLALWITRGERMAGRIRERLQRLLDAIPEGGVYQGDRTGTTGKRRKDGILHSSFFGLWMKAATIVARDKSPLAKAVFNDRGHIITLDGRE
jgi:hypothetical protein